MRESIIEVTILPELRVNNVNEYNEPFFIEFDYINKQRQPWVKIAQIKALRVIGGTNNISITESITTDFDTKLYIIVNETNNLFNLNLFLQSDMTEGLKQSSIDNYYVMLCDMLQDIIESYGVNLDPRLTKYK